MASVIVFTPVAKMRRKGAFRARLVRGTGGILLWCRLRLAFAAAPPDAPMNAAPGVTRIVRIAPMTRVGAAARFAVLDGCAGVVLSHDAVPVLRPATFVPNEFVVDIFVCEEHFVLGASRSGGAVRGKSPDVRS